MKENPPILNQSAYKPLIWKFESFSGNTLLLQVTFDRPEMISPLID